MSLEVAAAQVNVGYSRKVVPTMPSVVKIFLIINMRIGRIEIIPALVVLKLFVDLSKDFKGSTQNHNNRFIPNL
ncbi:MAG: hypothetical protein Q8N08_03960 [Methanobacteriaceae archaeon]|nr:hypothetical protein [Methanobacteriaceae archaeon]